jgi:hypothetical protein
MGQGWQGEWDWRWDLGLGLTWGAAILWVFFFFFFFLGVVDAAYVAYFADEGRQFLKFYFSSFCSARFIGRVVPACPRLNCPNQTILFLPIGTALRCSCAISQLNSILQHVRTKAAGSKASLAAFRSSLFGEGARLHCAVFSHLTLQTRLIVV